MTKKEIREIYSNKRKSLNATECIKLDDLLLIQFQKAPVPFITSLLSYWPMEENNEPNTHLFTDYLEYKNPGLQVAYPRADFFLNEMTAILIHEETSFVMNDYNIYEPEEGTWLSPVEIDMVLVPLIAFDKKGNRAGYGKGFYDRFLANCRKDCVKIGFSYFEPVDQISDTADFDVPLNLCITPQSIYVF